MGSRMIRDDIWPPGIRPILSAEEENEEDETFVERVIGLTEMFPENFRYFGYNIGRFLSFQVKSLYNLSCFATWTLFSSSAILFAPMIMEVERAQMKELQRSQQKQVLLGPNATMSHMTGPGMAMSPPIQ